MCSRTIKFLPEWAISLLFKSRDCGNNKIRFLPEERFPSGDPLPRTITTTVVVVHVVPQFACNARVSLALDASVAIATTLRLVRVQAFLSIPATRSVDALPALLAV